MRRLQQFFRCHRWAYVATVTTLMLLVQVWDWKT